MPMRRAARALAFAWALAAADAAAQTPDLVPPRAIETPAVPYPSHAAGEASVLLELSIDKEGKVARAVVVEGPEPFASAATAAAATWRYEPAHRGDVALAARIRVLVEFHEAKPEAPVAKPEGEARPAPTDRVEEVTVQGVRPEVARTNMGAGDVRQMPGAFGDAFRAIEALPGVTPIVSGLPYYFIRGAPPGNTGYLIDGVRVPLLFHFGVARAVIHPGLIDHVDFYPGGFPVRYGRFAGGIIDGQTKPPADRLHGEWDVSLLHAGALEEATFGDGRGHSTVAGRYGYPGILLSIIAPRAFLQYGDYQARVSWDLTPKDTVGAFVFGSYDAIGTFRDGKLTDLTTTQFHRLDMRWDRDLGHGARMRTAVTLGFDQSGSNGDTAIQDYMNGVRTEIDVPIARDVRMRAGSDILIDHYAISTNDRDTGANFPTRNDVASAIWADVVLKPTDAVDIVPGARFDYFEAHSTLENGSGAVPTFDPRLATRVRFSPRVAWVTTVGLTHQPPAFVVPVPGLQLGALRKGVQTAVQTSQGFEIALPLELTLAPTVFLHNYLNLTDATATCGLGDIDVGADCLDQRVRGRTLGLEILLRRPLTKRLTGWIAYTLSRSTREAHPLGSAERLVEVLSEFDRTHVLNVIGAYDLGANWRAGGRLFYYTGRPYSNRFHGVAVPPYNSERLPNFVRIDARLEKRWPTKTGYIAFVAEGLNITASTEVLDVTCTQAPSGSLALDKCVPDTKDAIPVIVPSIGVEGVW
jgi:TonB family protein